jgi:hypothetical protein
MSGKVGNNPFRASGVVADSATEFDDDQIQSNIAMLGFKVAVNGSLVRYNLVDQAIDEYYDTSGVDAPASVNERRVASGSNFYYDGAATVSPTVTTDADSTAVDGDYTVYKWTTVTASGDYTNDTTQDHEWLVIGGGAGGGGALQSADSGGAGGAGGYRTGTAIELTADTTYAITVGAGGAGACGNPDATDGNDSILSGADITTITSTGGGFGSNAAGGASGQGGSGGGGGASQAGGAGNTPAITQYTDAGETTTVQGFAGASGSGGPAANGAGGASAVGGQEDAQPSGYGGLGGAGSNNDITGETVGYAGGGAGGAFNNDTGFPAATHGGGNGGRGNNGPSGQSPGSNGTANTGGGGGGAGSTVGGGCSTGGTGGSGVVILRRLTSIISDGGDMTLQSTDVSATAQPDYGEFVTLIENAYGTATLNTDIKGYISRDSGSNFTQGTLADEGSWGTNKKILAFHDLDISGQPAGTSMCYKITTHNQSAASKETRVYAASIGWR